MNEPQDNIGLVKELQETPCTCDADLGSPCMHCRDIMSLFPFIAENLLIAVEALEKIAGPKIISAEELNDGTGRVKVIRMEEQTYENWTAKEYLKQIRSLSAHE